MSSLGKWALCKKCSIYALTTEDNKCSECGESR